MPIGIAVGLDISGIKLTVKETEDRTASAKALSKGIKIVNQSARAMAPQKLGHLKRSQGVKVKKGKKGKTISFALQGARTKYRKLVKNGSRARVAVRRVIPAKYDHLVIGGTRAHSLSKNARLERVRRGKVIPERGQGTGKKHPGAKANKYRQRAWNATRTQVGNVVVKAYGEELNKIFAKASARLKKKLN